MNALHISNQEVYDNITFHVINRTNIFTSLSGLPLDFQSKNLTKKIRKQMIKTETTEQIMTAANDAQSVI